MTASSRASSISSRSATCGQSSGRAVRWATSSSVRIAATGLRSSWEASATKRCWRVDASSSRSSIAFIVWARLATSSPLRGTGTRRSSVEPEMASTSARMSSTGRRARPEVNHASTPTVPTRSGKATSSPSRTASTPRRTGSSGDAVTRSIGPKRLCALPLVTATEPPAPAPPARSVMT
jgi:hypothetical protein